jgi:hypothetical protein
MFQNLISRYGSRLRDFWYEAQKTVFALFLAFSASSQKNLNFHGLVTTHVATQFLTHVLIKFLKNSKITKNNKNPKKYVL